MTCRIKELKEIEINEIFNFECKINEEIIGRNQKTIEIEESRTLNKIELQDENTIPKKNLKT